MAAPEANPLWAWLAEQARARGKPVRFRAHFSGDAESKAPVSLVLNDGEPMVELSPEAKALFDQIDPQAVVSRFADAALAARWLERFNQAREASLLTPNAACRLLLGPYFRPNRTVYAFDANVELRIDPRDAAEWFPDADPADATWPSLSDLTERFRGSGDDGTAGDAAGTARLATGGSPSVNPLSQSIPVAAAGDGRADANRIALTAIRAILEAAGPLELLVEGKRVDVAVERLPPEPWPKGGLTALDRTRDGPLPGAVRVACRWAGGEANVVVSVAWPGSGTYRHLLAVEARAFGKQVVWTNVAAGVKDAADGETVPLSGWCALFTQKDAQAEN
ncbi:MAG: hypothetical protein JOZ69_08405, partial [Myxococcales bacterium]|nr:hypothetical protein [Myxococcales bacterium]